METHSDRQPGSSLRQGDTMIRDFQHWAVHLRSRQVTLGSLVLTCKDTAPTMASLTLEAFQELKQVIDETEATLSGLFSYDKLNYLVLMMVDPHVHFHVIPRYGSQRNFGGMAFLDPSWPQPPDTLLIHETSDDLLEQLRDHFRSHWKARLNWIDGDAKGSRPANPLATEKALD